MISVQRRPVFRVPTKSYSRQLRSKPLVSEDCQDKRKPPLDYIHNIQYNLHIHFYITLLGVFIQKILSGIRMSITYIKS